MSEKEDPDLRRRFAALRDEDAQDTPDFARLWRQAQARRGRRPSRHIASWLLVAAGTAALLLATVGRHPHPTGASPAGTSAMPSLSQWRPSTDFLLRKRAIDTSSPLVLWQIGAIGVPTHKRKQENWSPLGLNILSEVLEQRYGPAHEVVIYEAGRFSLGRPVIQSVPLACLSKAAVTTASTLYVPPIASNGVRR